MVTIQEIASNYEGRLVFLRLSTGFFCCCLLEKVKDNSMLVIDSHGVHHKIDPKLITHLRGLTSKEITTFERIQSGDQ